MEEETLIRRLWKMVEEVWKKERMPGQWEEGLTTYCKTHSIKYGEI
jgi:hypothetical protein